MSPFVVFVTSPEFGSLSSTLTPSPNLNSTSSASVGTLSFLSMLVTSLLTYSICFSTMISEPSSNVTLTLPVKSPSLVVFLFSSVTSSNVAPFKSSSTSDFFASSLAFTPSFQKPSLISSPTHFLIATGSRPPRDSTLSAFVSSKVKVPGSDVSGALSSSATPPLSVTIAVTTSPPFTLSLGRVMTPLTSTSPSPSMVHPLSPFVAVVVFLLPSFPV